MLGGVDVQELFTKAWYVDAPALITADLSFMAPVQLLVCTEKEQEYLCRAFEKKREGKNPTDSHSIARRDNLRPN